MGLDLLYRGCLSGGVVVVANSRLWRWGVECVPTGVRSAVLKGQGQLTRLG